MIFKDTPLPGCLIIEPDVKRDSRGHFVKTFHEPTFKLKGLPSDWKESFYTLSKKNVLRGLHFQIPPADHDKLVCCVSGEIYDVVMDLRKHSPTYGQAFGTVLNDEACAQLYIPRGMAHGFLTLSPNAIVVYLTNHPYSARHDTGIHWESAKVPWPSKNPLVSERDQAFPHFSKFDTPFISAES